MTALPGLASAAAPTAPYDAFTINGTWNYSFDPSNAAFDMSMRSAEAIDFSATTANRGHYFDAVVGAPTGQTLGIGTFPTTRFGDATHYSLDVFGDSMGCSDSTGSVSIHALTRDPATNAVTSIAASYHQNGCYESWGELRWHSNMSYVDSIQSSNFLGFGVVDLGHSSLQTVTITSWGGSALTLGAASLGGTVPGAYTVTGNACTNATLAYGQSCTISVTGRPTAAGDQSATLTVADNTTFGEPTIGLDMIGHLGAEGTYVPVFPSRVLDTREGNGAPTGPLGSGKTMHLQVTGRGDVPSDKVSAVVLNMTVTGPTSAGYLTVYPTGAARPTASNLNFPAGWTGANSVTVPVGTNGQIDIFNAAGNVQVIADVLGYYYAYDDTHNQPNLPGGQYWATTAERVFDSRDPSFGGALEPSSYVRIPVSYGSSFDSHIRALAVNVTAVTPATSGYLTAWSGDSRIPLASTLNFTPGAVVPNFAVVPTLWCTECGGYPSIGVGNFSGGKTDVVVDIFGFYDDGQISGGLRFHPLSPTRIVDTRDGLGAHTFTGAGTATVTAPASVADANTYALVTNVTGVDPANSTFLSLWATGNPKPNVSNLNLTPHEVRPNAAFVTVGPGNKFNVLNAAWKVDVVIDVSGTFEFLPGSGPSTQSAGPHRQSTPQFNPAGTPQRQTLG